MARCLVTGGAGFIGSHLVKALLRRGDQVRVLDNFSTGKMENLAGLDGDLEVHEADLRDPGAVAGALKGVELVFHQAAFVSVPLSIQDPSLCFDTNVAGTITLLDQACQAGARGVVIASSAAVYGDAAALPVKETQALVPLSPYAASKRVDEIYADLYTRVFGLPVTPLRYFNVFGPRQSPDSDYAAAIPIFIKRMLAGVPATIFGDGLQGRDFVFVEDVVRANLLAAQKPEAAGQPVNICTGQEITILDLISTLNRILGADLAPEFAPPRPGDIYRSYGDPALARERLGFKPETTLEAGLARTVEWMRA